MDIKIPPKKWYIRYRLHIVCAILGVALIVMVIVASTGPKTMRINTESIKIAEVINGDFSEYVNAEGTLQPIATLRIYTREGGFVERLYVQDGAMVKKGDTIFTLKDTELERTIQDELDSWRKKERDYRTKLIQMDQHRITLSQSMLQTQYELNRLEKQHALDHEEYRMGIKSKAQLDVSDDEYNYRTENVKLQLESRRQDSILNVISLEALEDDMADARRRLERCESRLRDLVVCAPADGQLSGMNLATGLRVGSGSEVGDIKCMDSYRMHLSVNEFYIDRISVGQAATITYEKKTYSMRISSIVPEIKGGSFDVFLVFADSIPDNARIGKSYQARIEMGSQQQSIIVQKGNFYNYTHGQWVFRVNESHTRAVRVPVEIGRQNPRHYEISQGLQPGDEIIIDGYERISDADVLILN
jgi:RND family efflux transporter MFP subunit